MRFHVQLGSSIIQGAIKRTNILSRLVLYDPSYRYLRLLFLDRLKVHGSLGISTTRGNLSEVLEACTAPTPECISAR